MFEAGVVINIIFFMIICYLYQKNNKLNKFFKNKEHYKTSRHSLHSQIRTDVSCQGHCPFEPTMGFAPGPYRGFAPCLHQGCCPGPACLLFQVRGFAPAPHRAAALDPHQLPRYARAAHPSATPPRNNVKYSYLK